MASFSAASAARPFGRRGTLYLGTFLISGALLGYEVTAVRTINFAIGPGYIYYAIALAMLGLSSAGAILSLFDLSRIRRHRAPILFWSCVGIAALIVASHLITADTKAALGAAIASAGRTEGLPGVTRALIAQSLPAALRVGAALSLPYFLFGGILALLFATTEGRHFGRLYAADLVGAALGCIAAILVMETTGYAFSVAVPAIAALLAAAAFAGPRRRVRALAGLLGAACLFAATGSSWFAGAIEPPSDANYLVRDYTYDTAPRETWRGWNSFTRVGAVAWPDGERSYAVMSLNNGDGMAWLLPWSPARTEPWRHRPTVPALLLDPPDDALVLLAGAGADLMSLHEAGARHVVGVELNRTLVDGALALPQYRLAALLAEPSVELDIAEGRVFLERDTRRYDSILVSWSGASAAYYAGMFGPTTQFLYTYEGIAAMLDRLKPAGYAILLQVNKVNTLAALRRYLAAHGIAHAERTAVVLYDPADTQRLWNGPWDNNTLLIKPAGWSAAEVARLQAGAAAEGWRVAYAPGLPTDPDFTAYERIMRAADADAELAALQAESGRRFAIPTDDRPFNLDAFPNARYLDRDFWLAPLAERPPYELFRLVRVISVGVIALLAVLLILAPLALRGGPRPTPRTLSHLGYFFCLGTGFMLIEIALMQKASLLFGNPGLTIAIVLASVILFSGIGSLASDRSMRRGIALRTLALAVAAYALLLYLALGGLQHAVLAWPLLPKALFLAAVIAPLGLLMGQMFPQGLVVARRDGAALIPWAWGINGAMSTIVAGVAPLLAQAWGFNLLLLAGAGCYAAVVLLPTARPAATRPARAGLAGRPVQSAGAA